MEKVVILGANGQLGTELRYQLQGGYDVVPLAHDALPIEDIDRVKTRIQELSPRFVINTAAFHDLGQCEGNPQQSFLINAIALKWLSEACNMNNARLIHFSTNYVFGADMNRKRPYQETDLPGPIQIYGLSKLSGEYILSRYCNDYQCFRVSGIYGARGKTSKARGNFVEMMITLGRKAKAEGKRLPSANDQVLTFTSTMEIARIIEIMMQREDTGIFHATCEGYSTRHEFVRTLFEMMGLDVDVHGVPSEYFKPAYAQPRFSALDNARLKSMNIHMSPWKDALKIYLQQRTE
ncbi:MAG: NAD(P)-dependent oxidoreductase [Candidatus Lokiarchaeota archaeon]|nr:NAD(P)-dependent oxidoreductase [Candidatus Lokiarchaeota archaeon]